MPLDASELRISLQRLLAALIVMLLPITIFGFYLGLQAYRQAYETNGAYLRTMTRSAAAITSQYIGERITEMGLIANDPSVVRSVASASRAYEHMSAPEIQARTERIDSTWNSPESDALSKSILTSDLSRWLRRNRELNPRILRITVTDENGATVAATEKPTHYFQTEREYWQAIQSQGQGAIHISELRYETQSRANYISIGYPVLQEGTGRFIGAVIALVDVSPLFVNLNQQHFGHTGRVFLVSNDGTVVNSPGADPSLRVKSQEYGAIRDVLGTLQGLEAGYIKARLPSGETYLIGFADTGLNHAYPNLGWIVLASQNEREALGPVLTLAHFALFTMILGMLMLVILAAYVYLHQKQQLSDIEMPAGEHPRNAAA
jgi:hypothetical protein